MKYFVLTESFGPFGRQTSDPGSSRRPLVFPSSIATMEHEGPKIYVLRTLPRPRKRCFDWYGLLGLATMLGVSAAGWTGVVLLVSHFLK
jgi:hypothetical protein